MVVSGPLSVVHCPLFVAGDEDLERYALVTSH
jgi:hypothetical protein